MNYSLTYSGALTVVVASLAKILSTYGIELPLSTQEVVDLLLSLATLAGAAVVLYGRYRAGGVKWHGAKSE